MLYSLLLSTSLLCHSSPSFSNEEKLPYSQIKSHCSEYTNQNFSTDQIKYSLRKYVNNEYGWSPLNYAIEVKDFKSALILANYCENINQKDPFMKGSPQKINALERLLYHTRVKQGPKVHPSKDELQIAYILIERGIDVKGGPEVFSPIITACCFDIEDLIVRLTELGANVNASYCYSLYLSIENGNLNMARYLIDNGANIHLKHYQLFNAAINSQKIESIDFVLNLGLNISEGHYVRHAFNYLQNEIKDLDGCLYQSYPALVMFSYILEKGANPNYWVPKEGLNATNYPRAIDLCSLWMALELPVKTNAQYFYKNCIIQLLLDHGAVIP